MPDFLQALQNGAANLWLFIPTAILLGALHGLEPGHSKTMMAAFIIAIRGTVAQAVLLGLSAALSHSLIIWVLAAGALHFGNQWDAERVEPYLQIGSAVAILALAVGWGLALNLGFERLVTLDIMIYGASLSLEFVALIALRIREPELKRPFRVPGGLFGAIAVGIPPILLLGFAIVRSEHEVVLGMSSFLFALLVVGAGVVVYGINYALKPAGWAVAPPKPEMAA